MFGLTNSNFRKTNLSYKKVFDEETFLNKYNTLLREIYPEFEKILSLNGKSSFSTIKAAFKEKIYNASKDSDRIKINIAFEYFCSNPENISNYNSSDMNKLKIYTKFNPTHIIVSREFEDFKLYFNSKKSELNNSFDESFRSFLYVACKCGYKEFVIFLLQMELIPRKYK
jgi:hypothetical protein